MFAIDTRVSHPGHGACTIADICEMNLTGQTVRYYKLIPCYGSTETVYIPVASAKKIGIRSLITKAQARTLLYALPEAKEQWLSGSIEKQRRYKELFADNTIENLQDALSAMSAIIKRGQEKTLGSVDKGMLETIQVKAMTEMASVLEMSLPDAIQRAEDLILEPQ